MTFRLSKITSELNNEQPFQIARDRKLTYRVEIKPEFHESVSKEDIVAYEKHLIVKKKPKWIETPQYVHMSSATKGFNIIIDVAALRANTVHTTNVDLVEDGTSQRLVTIPITVVKEREHIFLYERSRFPFGTYISQKLLLYSGHSN